ncbi:TPA: hypothetical protein EYP38_04245 [Candidatus Micrarchaeota archaeon]|nr:hypothetical protein [Candidatus Micrarchaeota archaeon]
MSDVLSGCVDVVVRSAAGAKGLLPPGVPLASFLTALLDVGSDAYRGFLELARHVGAGSQLVPSYLSIDVVRREFALALTPASEPLRRAGLRLVVLKVTCSGYELSAEVLAEPSRHPLPEACSEEPREGSFVVRCRSRELRDLPTLTAILGPLAPR